MSHAKTSRELKTGLEIPWLNPQSETYPVVFSSVTLVEIWLKVRWKSHHYLPLSGQKKNDPGATGLFFFCPS